jgi:hypothetical protein
VTLAEYRVVFTDTARRALRDLDGAERPRNLSAGAVPRGTSCPARRDGPGNAAGMDLLVRRAGQRDAGGVVRLLDQ